MDNRFNNYCCFVAENYRFSKSHEWAALDTSNIATIGVSDHAQDSLGEAVYVDLPDVGTAIEGGG